jgi:hypothetical protein
MWTQWWGDTRVVVLLPNEETKQQPSCSENMCIVLDNGWVTWDWVDHAQSTDQTEYAWGEMMMEEVNTGVLLYIFYGADEP